MDGTRGGQGGLGAPVEDAGEGGGSDTYPVSKVHLSATLLLHDEFNAVFHNQKTMHPGRGDE